jgi:hypothetical protein
LERRTPVYISPVAKNLSAREGILQETLEGLLGERHVRYNEKDLAVQTKFGMAALASLKNLSLLEVW